MLKTVVYNQAASQVAECVLDAALFDAPIKKQVLFDSLRAYRDGMRQGTNATKTRAAVRGGGRKPWRQKGTGRARQGSIRSPQFRSGGVVFGPTPRTYNFRINRKMHKAALRTAYTLKLQSEQITILDKLQFEKPNTKQFVAFLEAFKKTGKRILIITDIEKNPILEASSNNVPRTSVYVYNSVGTYNLIHAQHIFIVKDAVESLTKELTV